MKKPLCFLFLVLFFFSSLPAYGSLAQNTPSVKTPAVDVYADAYLLIEKEDLHKISGRREHEKLPPASTTKIMTAIVVIEALPLKKETVVSEHAAGTEGSSAYLRAGEHVAVEDLLYCLMLQSANDAATALAECAAGSEEAFARLMNEKADELGLKDTHFENPHGLDAQTHLTSAYDLAALTSYALNNEIFRKIVQTKTYAFGKEESRRVLTNHNRLLFSLDGCIGVKTGYTMRSGRCLVSACERNGTTLICVTLGCRDDWNAHRDLYNYGFSTVKRISLQKNELSVPLIGKAGQTVLRAADHSFLCDPDAKVDLRYECPHFLFPPFNEGEKMGEMVVFLDGKETFRLPLVTVEKQEEPRKPGFFARLFSGLLKLFRR